MIDLQAFCDDTETARAEFTQPFNIDGHAYATDGHVLVRVAASEGFDANSISDKTRGNAPAILKDAHTITYGPIPLLAGPSDHPNCAGCDGRGEVQMCTACDGDGTTECGECGTEHDCENCDDGTVPWTGGSNCHECEDCDGTGKDRDKLLCTPGADGLFKWRYWRMIAGLPGVEVETPMHNGRDRPLIFRFIGGYAALMGMRRSTPPEKDVIQPVQQGEAA